MKYILALLLFSSLSMASVTVLPPGEVPALSMVQAYEILEKSSKKYTGLKFNPHSSFVTGEAWVFVQPEKNKVELRYTCYFNRDLNIIEKFANGKCVILAFNKNGERIEDKNVDGLEEGGPFE